MDDKMETHLSNHRLDFEKSGRTRLRNWNRDRRMVSSRWQNFAFGQRCKKKTVDKNWKDRMENEDKVHDW